MSDPFTAAYQAIGQALLADEVLAGLFRPGNRGDAAASLDVRPAAVAAERLRAGDLPRLRLSQGRFVLSGALGNSLAAAYRQEYLLHVMDSAGSLARLNEVKWRTARALARRGGDLGVPCVRGWRIVAGEHDASPAPFRRAAANSRPANAAAPFAETPLAVLCRIQVDFYDTRAEP